MAACQPLELKTPSNEEPGAGIRMVMAMQTILKAWPSTASVRFLSLANKYN